MTAVADDNVMARARRVRLAVFDVDGVLTDGRILLSDDGRESRAFSVRDGLGLKLLRGAGIEVGIISARRSPLVEARMAELGVPHVIQGASDKAGALADLLETLEVPAESASFTGDDLPDLPAMQGVGLAIAVADAHASVTRRANWVTRAPGGHGAVREICDLLLEAQGKLEEIVEGALAPAP